MSEPTAPSTSAGAGATATPTPPASPSLWRQGTFLRLWGGQAASQFGAQFAGLAIPVLAVDVLAASEFQVGVLGAAETAAFLVIGLPAGAWIDRMRKRRVMLFADLVRAVALGLIPLLWITGVLAIWHVVLVALVIGAATVFFDVSYQSYVPVLVPRDRISDANSKLETTAQLAHIGGPAAAGLLLSVVRAPLLLAATSLTYLVSFIALLTIRDDEVPPEKSTRRPLRTEIAEGLAFVVRQKLLFRIVLTTGVGNLFSTIAFTMFALLILRELDLEPWVLGVTASIGSIGGLLGAVFAARIGRVVGEGTAIPVTAILLGIGMLAFPASALVPAAAIPILIVGQLLVSVSVVVYNVTQVSFRQRICPPALLGRMNASIRFLVWGVMPIGGLISGLLGTSIGVVPTMWIGATGTLLSAGFVVFSPLLRMKVLPTSVEALAAPDA